MTHHCVLVVHKLVCASILHECFVTSYATIEAYTLEEDGVTRSSISVPTVRREVSSENPELISECNPPEPTVVLMRPGNIYGN